MKELEKKVAEAELKKVKDEILTYCTRHCSGQMQPLQPRA